MKIATHSTQEGGLEAQFFLNLLRGGLGGSLTSAGAMQLPTQVDWPAIYRLARQQAVIALVWDGAQQLPKEMKMPVEVGRRFFMDTLRTEQAARRLNALLATTLTDAKLLHIPVAILKGQGYAALYPNPLHRQPGDIDLFSGANWQRLQREMPAAYERDNGPAYFHDKLHRDGILIENHRVPAELNWPAHRRHFQAMVDRWFPAGIRWRTGQGTAIPVPPPWFELVHGVVHFAQHLTGGGVGLRQLCDWVVLMRAYRDEVDGDKLQALLHSIGLLRIAGAMTRLGIDWLGLERENALVPFLLTNDSQARRDARRMLEDILAVGNFGQEEHIRRHDGVAHEAADLLRRRGARTLRYFPLWPTEMACRALKRLRRFAQRKLQGTP